MNIYSTYYPYDFNENELEKLNVFDKADKRFKIVSKQSVTIKIGRTKFALRYDIKLLIFLLIEDSDCFF